VNKNECWTEEWRKKRRKLEEAGNEEALHRLMFCRFVCEWRIDAERTQKEAAQVARLTRVEWNRIENCHVFPHRANIPDIAHAIKIEPAVLFRKAGYDVPEEYKIYDKKRVAEEVIIALESSESFAEFLLSMQLIWQCYQQEQLNQPQRLVLDLAYTDIIAIIEERFTPAQKLRLAEELVQRAVPSETKSVGLNPQKFLDALDKALSEFKKIDRWTTEKSKGE
jgi:transcriptional regulator with XRE-family HTH domain